MHFQESKPVTYLKECLNKALQKGIPFVLFREPGHVNLCCLFLPEHPGTAQPGFDFIFHPFDPKHLAFRFSDFEGFTVPVAELEAPSPADTVKVPANISTKTKYIKKIQELKLKMIELNLNKVVLSRPIHLPVQRDCVSVFLRMLHRYGNACCYWWFHPHTGHWMGATPELLLAAEKDQVEIMSLAGTQSVEAMEHPVWSKKEYEEQEIVTRYIRTILEQQGGKVTVKGPNSLKAGELWHLCTTLRTGFSGRPKPLIEALHPTPAVCGYPVEGAKEVLERVEGYDREYYTGYFGVLSSDPAQRTAIYVNLRCLKWEESQITLYVGGGITQSSDAEQEWEETENKSRTMMDILDIFMD